MVTLSTHDAAERLREGQLVALPTETVYGLGAHAEQPAALRRVFELKQRPATHPLIMHIADPDQIARWAVHIPAVTYALAAAFWPGPLTLVLPCSAAVSPLVTAGQRTVALRCPAHPLFLAVLRELGSAVCAPSANRFGQLSPTTAAHVRSIFDESLLPYILDGGACTIGIESTILDLSTAQPRILRAGTLSAMAIAEVLGESVPIIAHSSTVDVRVSGTHRHAEFFYLKWERASHTHIA